MTVALVYEKEQQLRIMMRMHGLKDGPYWLVSYLYFLLLSLAYIFFLVAFGSLIRTFPLSPLLPPRTHPVHCMPTLFTSSCSPSPISSSLSPSARLSLKCFTLNPYGLQLLLYIVSANTQIALAMLLSTAFAHTRPRHRHHLPLPTFMTALQLFPGGHASTTGYTTTFMTALQLFPAFMLNNGASQALTWATAATNGYLTGVVILAVEWLVFLLLAIYLDQVVSAGSGVRKHPLFFLRRCKSGCRKLLGSLKKVLQSCRLGGDARVHAAFQEGSWRNEEGKEWKAGAAGSGKAEWGEGEVGGGVVGAGHGTDVGEEREEAKG
ncbi:unnamed protein product, partial [Closterium sp. Naga37s-1]